MERVRDVLAWIALVERLDAEAPGRYPALFFDAQVREQLRAR